ncbi:MAG: DUF2254 domain-containing protein [Pseudomonadota bacterium]
MLQSIVRIALQWFRRLYVRVSLYAVIAFLAVFVSLWIGPYLPDTLVGFVDGTALRIILTTLGTSMLAVTTFSLSILASSYHFAASNISPRMEAVISADTTTHSVLATFMGAFLFSLTGIMLLATPWVTEATVFVLFGATLLVTAQVIVAMIRWINHIESLSGYRGAVSLLQKQALMPVRGYAASPALGCNQLEEASPLHHEAGYVIRADKDGYVQQILETALQDQACDLQVRIVCLVQPGDFVTRGSPLARVLDTGVPEDEEKKKDIRDRFLIRDGRTFLQDPEFGLSVLAEIGVRALSPGVNDPVTAVDIIHRLSAILQRAAPQEGDPHDAIKNDRVWIAPVPMDRLYRVSLETVARYVDAEPELQAALENAYGRLAKACSVAGMQAARDSAERLKISLS